MIGLNRPRFRSYLTALLILALAWIGFIGFGSYQYWAETGQENFGMGAAMRNGVLIVTAVIAAAFGGHWGYKQFVARQEAASAPTPHGGLPATSPYATEQSKAMLVQTGQRYALEIRAMAAQVFTWSETGCWQEIRKKRSALESVLPQTKEGYPDSEDLRAQDYGASGAVAFTYSAGQSIDRWPLPSFVLAPPTGPGVKRYPARSLSSSRQNSGLGLALFTREWEGHDSSALDLVERLFAFFDDNPDVPMAFVKVGDSTGLRQTYKTPGLPEIPKWAYVPPIQTTATGLLVSRTDRIDRLMRPYVTSGVSQGINKTKTEHDIIKLWNKYWKERQAFDDAWSAEQVAKGNITPGRIGTMPSSWWHTKLPELWSEINNRGPGNYVPTNYLPIRWTDWQLRQFDRAPILGYLHRPVRIALTRPDGSKMRGIEKTNSVKAAWHQALGTLPEAVKPVRIFYDTSLDPLWVAPLANALEQDLEGLDVTDVDHGYDIGRRLGNTGVGSTLVQIALAAVAGYREGGAGATVHLTEHGYAGIVMVSPPDEATKQANKDRGMGSDPFNMQVPRQ